MSESASGTKCVLTYTTDGMDSMTDMECYMGSGFDWFKFELI